MTSRQHLSSESIERAVEQFAAQLRDGSRVLDVGCGTRPYEKHFRACDYFGIDVEASGRTTAGKRPDLFFDGVAIPLPDSAYDAVICTQVLEHCLDPEALMREIYRVLNREGTLFLTVPFIWGEHETPYDFRRYSTFGIRKLVIQSGFEAVQLERISAGVTAIRVLVESEMQHDLNGSDRLQHSWIDKILRRVSLRVWKIQLLVWGRLFKFRRIYLDNLVIARKP